MTLWELDFYSRPLFDENQKKRWELLVCESPLEIRRSSESLFRFSKFTDSQNVNSLWLQQALEEAISEANTIPKRIRFFRRQMNNMITKACEGLGIPAVPSRRTYTLNQWLSDRLENFYPSQPGYDAAAAAAASVQYPGLNAIPLPEALRGDRTDKWAFVSLEASSFDEMQEWSIGFGEAFPLEMMGVTPAMRIPGLIIFSARAVPLAAWMSGLELGFLEFEEKPLPRIRLETGASDSWILVDIKDPKTLAEAKGFSEAKLASKNVHFFAIQNNPNSEEFAGFWLLEG